MEKRFALITFLILTLGWWGNAKQTRFYGNGELSCNLITDICQDRDGFIWVGTASGLNRFDGWNFTHYFNQEGYANSLLSNYVFCLCADSQGRLWIGSNKGLQCFFVYEEEFHTITFPNNSPSSVEDIIELQSGEIWIVTSGQGIFSINQQAMTAVPLTEANNFCETLYLNKFIYQDQTGVVWVPMPSAWILRILPEENMRIEMLEVPSVHITSMAEDDKGQLFLASGQGVYRWNPDEKTFDQLENLAGKFSNPLLLHSKKGILYMGTSGEGLNFIDVDAMQVRKVTGIENRDINLVNVKIKCLSEDKDGNLWLGFVRKGLLMLPEESSLFEFWNFSAIEYESGASVSVVYEDKEGLIWAGVENGEMMRLNDNGEVVISYTLQKPVISLLEDSNHAFWVGTYYGGLLQFDKHTGKHSPIRELKNRYIKKIVESRDKKIVFSIFGHGFMLYDSFSGEWKQISSVIERKGINLRIDWINAMLSDSKGRVWLGHYQGINCYDPTKDEFLQLACDSVLNTTICYSLLEDLEGMIWIGTTHGLFRYDPETEVLRHYSRTDGLPDNVICGMAVDQENNIWCSTFHGLSKVHFEYGVRNSYLSGNGLFDEEYSRGVYFQGNQGFVYFGGVYGITRFYPDSIQGIGTIREPVLTSLLLNNQPVSIRAYSGNKLIRNTLLTETSTLRLSYLDNTFSMEFSMMDFRSPENIYYEYRLAGINQGWSQTQLSSNRITFNRLPPGNYNLQVRACENGSYSPVRNYQIIIIPPWYASTTAKVVYLLLLLLFTGWLLSFLQRRIKRKQQEEINEEKMKFFINISHEIRSPMTLIVSPLSMLMKREHDEVTMKALNSMYRNANRIVALLNQLLDIRRIDKGQMTMTFSEVELVGFIDELLKGFEYQAEKRKVSIGFEHQQNELPVWIDRNNFDKILINLLANAFKFTQEGGEIEVLLTVGKEERKDSAWSDYAEICVRDSGIGLNEKKLDKIFERFYQASPAFSSGSGIGLNLCKTLVELHHGTIMAVNRKDRQGSCFIVRIPLGNKHLKGETIVMDRDVTGLVPDRDICYDMNNEARVRQGKSKTRNKVLVIDDSEEICSYLYEELSPFYQVTTCDSAPQGFQVALDLMPDLIISDVVMPEMDGFTLLKKIKTNGNISHIPVILLTSRTEYDNRLKGWDKGADAILTKPFNMEELQLLSANLISGRMRLRGKFSGLQDQKEKVQPIVLKSNDEQLMERLMVVINKNIDNSQLSVELLAEEVGISRVQLHRRLKDIAGIPASEFIRNIRLQQAAELLKSRKTNISQVAYAVGYTSPSLFSSSFKKYYGISPREYLEKEIMGGTE